MTSVSIIVPCYNEQSTIRLLLNAIYKQNYPKQKMEVIIADGLSTDETRAEIAIFQSDHPDLQVQVVDNIKRIIPAGLNRAIMEAKGEVIVRLDAHSMPDENYVKLCVNALNKGFGENIGGVWQIVPGGNSWMARSIAAAAAHPLGVGDAHYRYTEEAMHVDTVPFGAFRRNLVEKIGPFDENLLTNEDYEFNVRVRKAGGRIWLDPTIRSTYFARGTLKALAHQYTRYGYWKARMLTRYPKTLRWRQALPPLFVLSLLSLSLLVFWFWWARWMLALELSFYFLVLILVGAQLALKNRDLGMILGVPLAIATMHLCWGGALLWSLFQNLRLQTLRR